jgi:hypothetical protein
MLLSNYEVKNNLMTIPLFTKISTAHGLGYKSLWRILSYRLGIKLGLNEVKEIQSTIESGDFFLIPEQSALKVLKANEQWQNQQYYFGWKLENTTDIPNWHKSVLTNGEVEKSNLNWWEIPDFAEKLGDVKGVWETSRFDWVICFAQQAANGDNLALKKLNLWIVDWCKKNPPYKGVNWKCGQEASIRVMHLAIAAIILHQCDHPSLALTSLIKAHLKRIEPTISYAVAQDNNHGTSEAAALFMGGSWLTLAGDSDGVAFQKLGLKWLENRAKYLIAVDGSFSQYSTNYHRVMLDTYSMAEVWRRKLDLPHFSTHLESKLKAATCWLYQFTQFPTGDVPNLGANDGARLLPLTSSDYRDFRPSVQLASVLFFNKIAWSGNGDWNLPLHWLGVSIPSKVLVPQCSFHFNQGGYFGIRSKDNRAFALMTYPKFNFRPSQCDALHVDFWLDGVNLLRDGGTFSYNAGSKYIEYYGGTESHNTVQFDNHEQMSRLSRFLLGGWLKARDIAFDKIENSCQASYKDSYKAKHQRKVILSDTYLSIKDDISGFDRSAILRWRLSPGQWTISGNKISNGSHELIIITDIKIMRFELITGKESRYYYQESELPVLEIEVEQAGSIITEYKY